MPNHDIQQKIINKIIAYYLDFAVRFNGEHQQILDLKMASFRKKLERLSRTELQGILDRIKPINYSQSAQANLKLLKNIIQSTPNHEYKHLVPAIDFFLYGFLDSFYFSSFFENNFRVQLANRMKNIIANGDIHRPNDFCNLIEKNLLLLNDIGYLSLFEFCNKPDSELIALGINWMLMSLASVALAAYATYSATGAYAATAGLSPPMALFITAVATHLILVAHFLILVFWVVETYQWINFKLGKNNLNTCIENIEKNIKVNNQLFAWAVLGLHESNKLPTDVSTHIGSFFPDGNKIEAEILLRDKNKLSKNPKLTKV